MPRRGPECRVAFVLGQHEMVVPVHVVGAPRQTVHAAAGDVERLFLGRRDREQHRAADAWLGVRAVHPDRVALVLVPGLDVQVVGALIDRAGEHQVHAVAAGRHRAAGIPERDRALDGLRGERNRREVVVRAVRARDLARCERVADDPERVLEALLRLRPGVAEPVVLDGRDPATDAEVEATAGELVDDAHVLDEPDRVVQRQQLHHRAEPDLLRDLARRPR